jgi:hypothetical protein
VSRLLPVSAGLAHVVEDLKKAPFQAENAFGFLSAEAGGALFLNQHFYDGDAFFALVDLLFERISHARIPTHFSNPV